VIVDARAGIFHCEIESVRSREPHRPLRNTNLAYVYPFHRLRPKDLFERFFGQFLLGQDLHDVFISLPALDDTMIFEREELWFFSVLPSGGENRPRYSCSGVQPKVRRVRMRCVSGEYRGEDGLLRPS
jgi:hypothetical protein